MAIEDSTTDAQWINGIITFEYFVPIFYTRIVLLVKRPTISINVNRLFPQMAQIRMMNKKKKNNEDFIFRFVWIIE